MLPPVVLLLVAIALTSCRLTRLLTVDEFPPIKVQRMRVLDRWGPDSWQAYLSRCPWCMGVWMSGAVTAATWLALDGFPMPVLVWGAAAWASGFLVAVEPGD